MRYVRDFTRCPRCGAMTRPAISIQGTPSEYWYECTLCNTYINTYIPQEHQAAVHEDAHTYIGNFGGYGTGKTTTSREEFYKHMFITPKGNTLIGANVSSQYEQTIKRDIEADFPINLVDSVSVQKSYIDFNNGHRLMFRPLDDEGKLRSYNLSMFIIVEASEVDAGIFAQLKTRLRNGAATKQLVIDGQPQFTTTKRGVQIPKIANSWLKGIIESNPDSGFIRTDVLLVSDNIVKHGRITDEYAVMEDQRDPATASHIAATEVNEFLPPNFIENISKNKPTWWVRRYVKGSFSYSEGLVYPRAMDTVVPAFEIPKDWKRIIAFDYGLSDPSRFLFGAIDERQGKLYIYKELSTDNQDVSKLAEMYIKGSADIPSGMLLGQPIIDPKSGPKRDYNKKSLGDHFLDYGIAFKPGFPNVDARIFRLNTYIESGYLKIFDSCVYLLKELRDYKYPNRKLGDFRPHDKPVDKNNHSINCLEWIVMELPANPKNILYGVYNSYGEDVTIKKTNTNIVPWNLRDAEEDFFDTEDANMFGYVGG